MFFSPQLATSFWIKVRHLICKTYYALKEKNSYTCRLDSWLTANLKENASLFFCENQTSRTQHVLQIELVDYVTPISKLPSKQTGVIYFK